MHASRLIRRATAAAALLIGAAAAQAALLKYDFVVTLDGSGDTYSGSLEFDDAPGGATVGSSGESRFALTDFSFDFIDGSGAAKTYTEADLASSEAVVDGGGFAGIDADEMNSSFAFVSAFPAGPASFGFDFAGGTAGNGTGLVDFHLVPNPASAALLLVGLGLMGSARRTRAS